MLGAKRPASLRSCVLVSKPGMRRVDVHGGIPFEPITFRQNAGEAVIGMGVAIITLAVPVLLPNFFQIAVIPIAYWIGLAALTVVTAFTLWRSTLEQTKILAPLRALLAK